VIPAYNEAARLPSTLARTLLYLNQQQWSSRVVVVDNGSADDTWEVASAVAAAVDGRVPVDVIGCARPGKGAAVRRGVLSSRSRFVGFFDADLATPPETLEVAVAELRRGAAAVIGSRHMGDARFLRNQPLGRRVGGAAFRCMARRVVKDVRDTQCGFKFFERRAVTRALAQCRVSGFAFDVELLRNLQRDGERIVEIPVAWTDSGQSSFHPLRDGAPAFASLVLIQRLTWTP
jgi:glycosyltransferase involved in cell wall biosynthesis